MNDDAPRLLRAALADPIELCQRLGIANPSKPNGSGLVVRCPWHAEKKPSCSVTKGPDGTVRVKCFGCGHSADALGLVGAVYGLVSFRDTLRVAAEIAGREDLLDEPLTDADRERRRRSVPEPQPRPDRDYADPAEIRQLWERSVRVTDDAEASATLVFRRIDPDVVASRGLARVVQGGLLPRFAAYKGRSWVETGHRLLMPAYDADGAVRGLRARLVVSGADAPKCLPPAGCKGAGLVLANRAGVAMLAAGQWPGRVWIAEGETDFLALATQTNEAVIGIGSGSWTEAHARRVPLGTTVMLATDADQAGDRYAHGLRATLAGRAQIVRC